MSGLFLTLLIGFLGYLFLSLRWAFLMRGGLGFFPAFETVVIADFLNIALPARIGDISKIFYLKKYYTYDTRDSFSILFIERFLDLNILLLFAIFISFFYSSNEKLRISSVIMLFFVITTIFLIKTSVFLKFLRFIPIKGIRNYIEKIIEGINSRLTLSSLWIALGYTFLLWFSYFLKNIIFFKYTAYFPLSIFQVFILFAFSTVSFVVPITPGGIGAYQASVVFIATLYGISKEEALVSGVVLQGFQILTTVLCFLFILLKKGISFRQLKNLS